MIVVILDHYVQLNSDVASYDYIASYIGMFVLNFIASFIVLIM